MADTVDKVILSSRDETLIREMGPHRNYDSSLALTLFKYCAAEHGDRLYQQYRQEADLTVVPDRLPLFTK